jgi:hypothetical protein
MGHSSRREQRITGMEREPLLSHLHEELALYDVEPLVLIEVAMARWPTLRMERVLMYEQAGAALVCDLELKVPTPSPRTAQKQFAPVVTGL